MIGQTLSTGQMLLYIYVRLYINERILDKNSLWNFYPYDVPMRPHNDLVYLFDMCTDVLLEEIFEMCVRFLGKRKKCKNLKNVDASIPIWNFEIR